MMQRKRRVLIIIPAYNEEHTIGKVLYELTAVANKLGRDNIDLKILVIDDGSTDRTVEIAKKYNVLIVSHLRNMGPGVAVRTGFLYAIKNNFDFIVRVDADGQHPPNEIPKILKPVLDGEADVVIGSRFLHKTSYKMPFIKKLGIKIYSLVVLALTKKKIIDLTSGFRAFNLKAVKTIVHSYPPDFPALKSTLTLIKSGLRVIEVPIKMNPRFKGRSYISGIKLLRYHLRAIKSVFEFLVS